MVQPSLLASWAAGKGCWRNITDVVCLGDLLPKIVKTNQKKKKKIDKREKKIYHIPVVLLFGIDNHYHSIHTGHFSMGQTIAVPLPLPHSILHLLLFFLFVAACSRYFESCSYPFFLSLINLSIMFSVI